MSSEYEIVRFSQMRNIHLFFNRITYRNAHYHAETEIILVLEGEGSVLIAGNLYYAHKGSLFVINSNESHEFDAVKSPLLCLLVQISPRFLKHDIQNLKDMVFAENDLSSVFNKDELKQVSEGLISLAGRFFKDEPYYELEIISSLLNILLEIKNNVGLKETIAISSEGIQRRERWHSYIEEHINEPVGLKELAEKEGLTVTYLSHLFVKYFGISFQEYLNNMRFERALILIRKESLSLYDVSLAAGFSAPKYMNAQFKKHYSCTAREFRNKKIPAEYHVSREIVTEYIYDLKESRDLLESLNI